MSKTNTVAHVTAKHAPAKFKRGKVHHITVTPSDNGGATVEARFHPAPGSQEPAAGGPMMDYEAREAAMTHRTTHEDADSAVAQVGQHLGAKGPVEDKDEDGE